jgi:hypothetical protein
MQIQRARGPGLVANFWEYLRAAGLYWWAALAVLLGLERLAERAAPNFWQKRVDPWFTPDRRRQALIAFAIFAFVIGNFRAWDEERAAKEAAEQKLVSGTSESRWAPLTASETSAFTARVASLPPENLIVSCDSVNCKDLADGIAAILKHTPGWTVATHHGGGLDITGFTGIVLHPKEPATEQLKDAIEATTNLKVKLLDETRAQVGTDQSFLVVGIKPF